MTCCFRVWHHQVCSVKFKQRSECCEQFLGTLSINLTKNSNREIANQSGGKGTEKKKTNLQSILIMFKWPWKVSAQNLNNFQLFHSVAQRSSVVGYESCILVSVLRMIEIKLFFLLCTKSLRATKIIIISVLIKHLNLNYNYQYS